MAANQFLLYGANGYTGELILQYAKEYDLQPILAGRRAEALAPLSKQYGYPYVAIDINDAGALQAALRQVSVVVHAAGPYDFTARQMVEACLATDTHYLDLNGDMVVFEMIQGYDEAAKKAGIMLLPGAGFDVVPTDCLALFLKKALPDATRLELAFATPGGTLSKGTALTTALKLGEPGAERKNNKVVAVPVGEKGMEVPFVTASGVVKKMFVMSLPWGDVFTAWFTTGIPNITAYINVPKPTWFLLQAQGLFNWILRTSAVKNLVKAIILKRPAGPTETQRQKASSLVWGRVSNAAGNTATATLSTPEAYTLTAHSTLLITKKILEANYKTGYQTPAGAYGEDLVMELNGVARSKVEIKGR